MKKSVKTLILIMTGMLLTSNVYAADGLVSDSGADQSINQSQGNYQSMNLGYMGFGSIGMFQEAWQDPLQNLGEGQSKPAYSKYYWSPDLVLPVRLREGMITMINFPEWELIERVFVGDTGTFTGQINPPNTVMLWPTPQAPVGNDTNVIVVGRSGNKYVFYARSEGVNTERITNSIIDIDVVGQNGASGGSPRGSGKEIVGTGGRVSAVGYGTGMEKTVDATFTRRFLKEDWLKSIPMDPEKFRFDIEIYVPNPDDVIIAPERVWHDDIFTYIDLGEKAVNMVQRPIVTMIIERSETPVGFRTKGPNNRLIIVEGVGDMVMRSGKRMVCLKMRELSMLHMPIPATNGILLRQFRNRELKAAPKAAMQAAPEFPAVLRAQRRQTEAIPVIPPATPTPAPEVYMYRTVFPVLQTAVAPKIWITAE